MKKLLLLIAFAFLSCSQDERCHECKATYYNEVEDYSVTLDSDCNHESLGEDFIFVECDKQNH